MLNKELCKKCWNEYGKYPGWQEFDEECWEEKRYIYCPPEYLEEERNTRRSITAQPPSKCPYLLEYVLNNQGKKEEVKEIEEPV